MPADEPFFVDGIKLTPRMQNMLNAAARVARRHGHDYIGTEHFLHAFLDEGGGLGPGLIDLHCDVEVMRSDLVQILETRPDE